MTGDAGIVATPRAHEATAPSLEQQHPSLNLKLSAAAPTSAGSPNTAHVAHATAETASQAQHQHRHGGLRRVHLVPTDLSKTIYRTHQSLFEDIVFDEARWEKHRNSWYRHRIEPIVFLRVALGFFWQILLVVLISIAVGLYEVFLVPMGAPAPGNSLSTVFNLLTFALSLLLVFKTNSSFARWWEGRIIWGQLVNCTRNYARMVLQYAPPHQSDLAHLGVTWMIASTHVLRGYIRQMGPDAIKEAAHILTQDELQYLAAWRNPPAGVARVLSWVVSELQINAEQQRQLEEQVISYVNNAGACERVYKTPIPAAYTRHTSRFLMIFLSISPILLWPASQWLTPVIIALVAFLLLGTENIGVQIEEPFRVLPLDAISNAIEANLREMEEQHLLGNAKLKEMRANASAYVAARQAALS